MTEVAAALELIEKSIHEGFKPSDIAILLTNERAYGEIFELFKRNDVSVNLASSFLVKHLLLG